MFDDRRAASGVLLEEHSLLQSKRRKLLSSCAS
jgi:hypothetical protein